MTEELGDDAAFARMSPSRQRELIASYCVDIELQIASASTASEAAALVENACREFRNECASKLVATALSAHVGELLKQYWGS